MALSLRGPPPETLLEEKWDPGLEVRSPPPAKPHGHNQLPYVELGPGVRTSTQTPFPPLDVALDVL